MYVLYVCTCVHFLVSLCMYVQSWPYCVIFGLSMMIKPRSGYLLRTDDILRPAYQTLGLGKLHAHIPCISGVSLGNLDLTALANLDRPYLEPLSGHHLTAAAAPRSCSREKNTMGDAIRSVQWLAHNAPRSAFSQKPEKVVFDIFYFSKRRDFV
jgi:hypothetical protein